MIDHLLWLSNSELVALIKPKSNVYYYYLGNFQIDGFLKQFIGMELTKF